MADDAPDVLVVGGGLAGLAAARRLEEAGAHWHLVDGADAPGGRVRTDPLEGFLLDRGFQVLLTGYPEARAVLDYDALDLRAFQPGALVRTEGRFHRVADPFRQPSAAVDTLRAPVGSLMDKLRVAMLRVEVLRSDPFAAPERTTDEELRALGFSDRMRERFLRPLFAGIMLDPLLGSSNRMFRFVFAMLSRGDSALPARGMQALPDQMASTLPAQRFTYDVEVTSIDGHTARLSDGRTIEARRALVVATDGPAAAKLLDDVGDPGSRATSTVYFAAARPPVPEPVLVLDGDASGPVNHLCVPSQVAPAYAPDGASLVSASVLDDRGAHGDELVDAVRSQLSGWFGPDVDAWRHLRTYRIPHAQPDQSPPALSSPQRAVRLGAGRYVCGDHRDNASINGALVSGRRAADAVVEDLRA